MCSEGLKAHACVLTAMHACPALWQCLCAQLQHTGPEMCAAGAAHDVPGRSRSVPARRPRFDPTEYVRQQVDRYVQPRLSRSPMPSRSPSPSVRSSSAGDQQLLSKGSANDKEQPSALLHPHPALQSRSLCSATARRAAMEGLGQVYHCRSTEPCNAKQPCLVRQVRRDRCWTACAGPQHPSEPAPAAPTPGRAAQTPSSSVAQPPSGIGGPSAPCPTLATQTSPAQGLPG